MRISKNDYYISLANAVAARSTCLRRQVGCVVVVNDAIQATGYNGAPRGTTHCEDRGGCLREKLNIPSGERHELCYAVHAEANAIAQAAIEGKSLKGGVLYCNVQPCSMCAKLIINAGIEVVYFETGYPDAMSFELFCEANIQLYTKIKDESGNSTWITTLGIN